jgi:DNA-binding NarL/FixJ family response regulator
MGAKLSTRHGGSARTSCSWTCTCPSLNGLAATRLISAEQSDVKVVILTASEEDAHLFEAIKSGAQGYLFKNLASDELFRLLEGVAHGEPALTPALARKLLGEFARPAPAAPTLPTADEGLDALTEREREVLDLLVQGITSNRELAERLVISENTVKYHFRNILDKLCVQNAPRSSPWRAPRQGGASGIGSLLPQRVGTQLPRRAWSVPAAARTLAFRSKRRLLLLDEKGVPDVQHSCGSA